MNIKKEYFNVNFQSGLSSSQIIECQKINIKNVEKDVLKNYHINANFNNCKPLAFCTLKALGIFEKLSNYYNIKIFNLEIPQIRVFKKNDLLFNFNGYGFCLPEEQLVTKKESIYSKGAIFLKKENSLNIVNKKSDFNFKNNFKSSSHYLYNVIHEFMHNAFLNLINKSGNGHEKMILLQNLTISSQENNIIKKILGNYATLPLNQYHEIFAETFTQLVCNNLSPQNSTLTKNPLEDLRKYPKEFLKILYKILKI